MTIVAERPVAEAVLPVDVVTADASTTPATQTASPPPAFRNALQREAATKCFTQAPDGCRLNCPNGWGGDTERGGSEQASANRCAAAAKAFGGTPAPSATPPRRRGRISQRSISAMLPNEAQ